MKNKNYNERQSVEIARLTFDWINTYIPTLRTNSVHTVRAYKTAVNLYVRYLDEKGITDKTLNAECFSACILNDWLIWLRQERGCSRKTCNNRLAAIKCLLKYIGSKILPYQRNRKNDERMKRCIIVVKFPRSIKCLRIHSKDIDYKRLHEYRRSVSYGMCGKGRNRSRMKYITVQIRAPALDGITKRTGF